jgi:glycosyltransferase involved in cell wall biosynthesis
MAALSILSSRIFQKAHRSKPNRKRKGTSMRIAKPKHDVSVLVVGSSNGNAGSMDRYSALLVRTYQDCGIRVRLACPPNFGSKKIAEGTLKKYVKYVESLLIFPIYLAVVSVGKTVHFADHSDAILMPWTSFSKRRIVTCHDLIAVRAALGEIPEYKPKALGIIYQALVARGLKKADSIAAVSNATAADVKRLVPATQVSVLHNPLDFKLAPRKPLKHSSQSYFLIVSHSSWRKSRNESIRLWVNLLSLKEYETSKLVIVGPQLNQIERLELNETHLNQVECHNLISDEKLAALYAGCTALIQMSKYEGFGWPVIEANAQGRPAICSDIEVFREIGGQNVFISPNKMPTQIQSELREFSGDEVSQVVVEKFSLAKFKIGLFELLSDSES